MMASSCRFFFLSVLFLAFSTLPSFGQLSDTQKQDQGKKQESPTVLKQGEDDSAGGTPAQAENGGQAENTGQAQETGQSENSERPEKTTGLSEKSGTSGETESSVNESAVSKDSAQRLPGQPAEQSKAPETLKPADSQPDKQGVPLLIGNQEVFRIKVKLGPYSPELRIEAIESRLKRLLDQPDFNPASIKTSESRYSTDIVSGGITILTVTDLDAEAEGAESRQVLASKNANLLRIALEKEEEDRSLPTLFWRTGLSLLASVLLFLALCVFNVLFPKIYSLTRQLGSKYLKTIKIQNAVLLSQATLIDVLVGFLRVCRLLLVISLLLTYLTLVLSFFPQTRNLSDTLLHSVSHPIIHIALPALLGYLPNLFFIAIIVIGSYYVISFCRFLFNEIARETISFPSFDPSWAEPTYKIARFLLIAFTLVLIFPYLPGSGSPAFQQISLFLGILFSLGSSGSVSHIVAGIFLTYTGAFRVGDRVKIADTIGDVVEKTLLATRVQTIKQEIITIPNGLVLGSHIINYSSSANNPNIPGLILHSTVTIGYDVPWRQVHQLLIDAALECEGILKSPQPFVLQTSLDDFYVSYQINAYTNTPQTMAGIYSHLHQNIQDTFNKAGVEIMSPQYANLRDGNKTTIPESCLPAGYEAASFSVQLKNK